MVPGEEVLKGEGKPWIFTIFWGVENGEKHETNPGPTWSDFGLLSSRPSQNDLLKNPEKIRGFQLKKTFFNRNFPSR